MSAESLREAERRGAAYLAAAGREEAAQTARLLLCHILGMDFTDYILARERELPAEAARYYAAMLEQRARGVPLQYLTKAQNFCGLELYVDERVLIPRYDTECLVEAVLRDRREGRLLDLCTGSGCIPRHSVRTSRRMRSRSRRSTVRGRGCRFRSGARISFRRFRSASMSSRRIRPTSRARKSRH